MRVQHLVLVAGALWMGGTMFAANLSPVGLWKTTDDKTGKPKGLVRVWEDHGGFFGKVEKALNPKEADQVCDLCKDERRNKPVVGMVILRHMRKTGVNDYTGGDILDPDEGKVYRCKFHLEDGGRTLIVRGYIGFSLLGRSQTWQRQE